MFFKYANLYHNKQLFVSCFLNLYTFLRFLSIRLDHDTQEMLQSMSTKNKNQESFKQFVKLALNKLNKHNFCIIFPFAVFLLSVLFFSFICFVVSCSFFSTELLHLLLVFSFKLSNFRNNFIIYIII